MDESENFRSEVTKNIAALGADNDVHALSRIWVREIAPYKYAYNFHWMGRPAIQFPQDMVMLQELVWGTRPDLIIETGIAHGGSLVMNASLLALLDYCDAVEQQEMPDPRTPGRRIIGIDIDIRDHNRAAIEAHPMASRIDMVQGSSIDPKVVMRVREMAHSCHNVMVLLDSNHTHAHVLAELHAYAPLVSIGSYCIVFDTLIEQLPDYLNHNRPWGVGNNPMTAVQSFIKSLTEKRTEAKDGGRLEFEIDRRIDNKLLISSAPSGYLRRVARDD